MLDSTWISIQERRPYEDEVVELLHEPTGHQTKGFVYPEGEQIHDGYDAWCYCGAIDDCRGYEAQAEELEVTHWRYELDRRVFLNSEDCEALRQQYQDASDTGDGNLLLSLLHRIPDLLDTIELERERVQMWVETGDKIMLVAVGKESPLSDSDVIGEIQSLRYRLEQKELECKNQNSQSQT